MILVDAGALYAALDRDDRHHATGASVLQSAGRPLRVPESALAEVAYFSADRLGDAAEVALARAVTIGEVLPVPTVPSDWARIVELSEQYLDLPLGIVDAAVVAIAERLDVTTIATVDRRDFSVVRPRHCSAFTLVP